MNVPDHRVWRLIEACCIGDTRIQVLVVTPSYVTTLPHLMADGCARRDTVNVGVVGKLVQDRGPLVLQSSVLNITEQQVGGSPLKVEGFITLKAVVTVVLPR